MQAVKALKRSEERYALAQRAANIGSWDWDIGTSELVWSERIEPMFGFGRGEFGATYEAFLGCVHPEDRPDVVDSVNACIEQGKDYAIEHRIVWPDGTVRWVSETGDVIRDENGKAIRMVGIVQDITERKNVEARQRLAGRILESLNREAVGLEAIRDVVTLIKEFSGFEAVGIRLHEGDDFPYFETNGFSEDFVQAENYLCARDKNGKQIYDSQDNPVLECMCGNVLSGRTDPTLPFFTEGGSFWTNSTTELLASPWPQDLQGPIRGRCNRAGYESVALIPLRSGDQVVGLLQLNDSRLGRFATEIIRFFEEIGVSIGIALARIAAEEDVKNLAKFPSEDPSPVLRVTKDGVLLYANAASGSLLTEWGCKVGQVVPEKWCQMISEVFASGSEKKVEIEHGGRVLSFLFIPVVEADYVNIYGRDITKRKQAEKALRESRQRYKNLFEQSPVGIGLASPEGKIVTGNSAMETLTGYSIKELRKVNVADMYDNSEERQALIEAVNRYDGVVNFPVRLRRKDGTVYDALLTISRVHLGGEDLFQTICIDITEREKQREALQEAKRELTIRNKIAEIFLTIPDEEMFGEVLQVILEAMESQYGIFGYIDEHGVLIIPSMTRDIWEKCQVPDKTIVYPREKWGGIWGRALVEKRSLFANEGLHVPEGHLPITRALIVPVMYGGQAIGLLEVANKSTDYSHKDQEFLETIAGKIAPILNARLQRDREERERRQAEEALKLHEIRLQASLDLNKMAETSQEEILDFVREEITKITRSKFAFIGFMNEDESVQTTHVWSKEVMRQCAIVETPRQFPLAKAGLWGEAVRQRKPIIINDYVAHPHKKGYPKGHVPITRFLCIPVFDGERIVMVAAVANKETEYDESDVRAFTSMMNDAWRLIRHKQAEQKVENLAKFPSENPNPVLRVAKDGTLLYANVASESLLAEWSCQADQIVPEKWRKTISEILASASAKVVEIEHAKRAFAFMVAPVVEAGYANLYGQDITERKQAEEDLRKHRQHLEELVQARTAELTEANRKLLQEIEERKRLEKEILNISEQEQQRIGRELHDSIGQQFTGIAFMMKVLEQKLATKLSDEAADASEITKLVKQAMDQTRGLVKGLHPVDLDAGSLMSALQEFATSTQNLFGICCTFKCDKPIPIDDAAVAVHLYRITQEAVTNAIKHGGAKNIQIGLTYGRDKSVLTVKNDGLDFPKRFEKRGTGMGLQIMDHRVDIIGGSLDIHKASEGGTIVTCTFPNKRQ